MISKLLEAPEASGLKEASVPTAEAAAPADGAAAPAAEAAKE